MYIINAIPVHAEDIYKQASKVVTALSKLISFSPREATLIRTAVSCESIISLSSSSWSLLHR